jgi:hypothetical protein
LLPHDRREFAEVDNTSNDIETRRRRPTGVRIVFFILGRSSSVSIGSGLIPALRR